MAVSAFTVGGVPESVVEKTSSDCPPFAAGAVALVVVVAGVVAVLSATRYGYYYDELYFIAAGKRPSFSYADQGPLVPLLARGVDWVFPGSFVALRIQGIIAVLVVVTVSALIAREFGGGRSAQVLAAVACSTAFGILGEAGTLTTNIIDTAMWALLSWLVVRWVRTRRDGLLLVAGLVTMAALQVKWLIPIFWIATLIAVGCLGPRELLRRPTLWFSAVAVALSAIPMLIWQSQHGWPQAAMGAVIRGQTSMLFGPATFIPRAVQMCGVLGAVLLVYGAWQLWRSPRLQPYRFLGLTFLIVVVIFAVTGGRIQYGAGIYAAVIAAGAVELTALRSRWVTIAAVPVAVVSVAAFVIWATPWRPASQLAPATDFAAGLASRGLRRVRLAGIDGDGNQHLPRATGRAAPQRGHHHRTLHPSQRPRLLPVRGWSSCDLQSQARLRILRCPTRQRRDCFMGRQHQSRSASPIHHCRGGGEIRCTPGHATSHTRHHNLEMHRTDTTLVNNVANNANPLTTFGGKIS